MKIFSHIASRRNRRTIVAVFEVEKEIPAKNSKLPKSRYRRGFWRKIPSPNRVAAAGGPLMKRLLVLVTFLSYALLAFSQSDNPNKPTWWNKYQYLAKHGTSGNGGTSNSLSVGSNVDASNECGPQSET